MQLVLDTKGLRVEKRNQSFLVISQKGKRSISPGKLTSIAVTANIVFHTEAIVLAIKNKIPILFFDRIGKAKARLWSPYFESIATLRRNQVRFAEGVEGTAWIVDLMGLKANGQIQNLKYLRTKRLTYALLLSDGIRYINTHSKKLRPFREQLIDECRNNLMGTEGTIARIYWQSLGNAMPDPYGFNGRSRRPAKDIFNAAINYLYGMLYSVVEGALFAAGLDPHLGILHTDEHTKPTLAFDLIEAFRPWIDRLLIDACMAKKLQVSFFTKNQYGLFLNKEGKAFIIPLFNAFLRKELSFLNRNSTIKNHIYYLAGRLARRIRTAAEG